MLIAHLIAGAILFVSFSLRMPQVSSALSLFLTPFKPTAPVSPVYEYEDVFSISPTLVHSPSFCADVVSSPSPVVTNSAIYHPPNQYPDFGSTTDVNKSADSVVQEILLEGYITSFNGDEEKPMSNHAMYPKILHLLASLCATLILYLIYVSHLRKHLPVQL